MTETATSASFDRSWSVPLSAPSRSLPGNNADVILPLMSETVPFTDTLIAVGASVGGTEAIRSLISQLPGDAPPMVIVQHMPESFTHAFAGRMNAGAAVSVREAVNGEVVSRGTVLIAPGGHHLLVHRRGTEYVVEVRGGRLVSMHRPSVDVLLRSMANAAGQNGVGVILTGMGDDGSRGLREMRNAGAMTIAQDEVTSAVFGMPRAAIAAGSVRVVAPLQAIAGMLLTHARYRAS